MGLERFYIDNSFWAERDGKQVKFCRDVSNEGSNNNVLELELSIETLRNLLVWADQERSVTASLTGPMAAQVRQAAEELGLTPEMFIWHAVKIFIDVGSH